MGRPSIRALSAMPTNRAVHEYRHILRYYVWPLIATLYEYDGDDREQLDDVIFVLDDILSDFDDLREAVDRLRARRGHIDKLAGLETLAERGDTEGEREAACRALERLKARV